MIFQWKEEIFGTIEIVETLETHLVGLENEWHYLGVDELSKGEEFLLVTYLNKFVFFFS